MVKCPKNCNKGFIESFFYGGYCKTCADFDEEKFVENWHPPFFLVFSFIRQFTYRDFKMMGDPVLAMIASEIWLYNVGRYLAAEHKTDLNRVTHQLLDEGTRQRLLPKCNTHSLAQYFDLPYQTVRRKVITLVERGMVQKDDKGNLHITAACEAAFSPELNLETMRHFVSTARCVLSMLEKDQDDQ